MTSERYVSLGKSGMEDAFGSSSDGKLLRISLSLPRAGYLLQSLGAAFGAELIRENAVSAPAPQACRQDEPKKININRLGREN
jgi:hypothetical protein